MILVRKVLEPFAVLSDKTRKACSSAHIVRSVQAVLSGLVREHLCLDIMVQSRGRTYGNKSRTLSSPAVLAKSSATTSSQKDQRTACSQTARLPVLNSHGASPFPGRKSPILSAFFSLPARNANHFVGSDVTPNYQCVSSSSLSQQVLRTTYPMSEISP